MANTSTVMRILTRGTILLTMVILFCGRTNGFFGEWGPDLEGPWCATRPPGQDCCQGRDDYCGVPILGTECYCDIFCNETAYDCCPDYWAHCHGVQNQRETTTLPPPRSTRPPQVPCYRDGKLYMPGETIKDNCNMCTCVFDEYAGSEFMCSKKACLVRPQLIQELNDGPYTWAAKNYSKFWGMSLDEGVRYRLGTFLLPGNVLRMTPLRVEDDVLPESFDARSKWPNLLHPIRDQGNCASSWAHSTTAVASDRLAIETGGAIKAELSRQMLLSCNTNGQLGCQGGHLDRAWVFLRKHGVVTDDCYPYESGQTDEAGECKIPRRTKAISCPSGVTSKSNAKFKATPPYRIRPLEREIMKEIMDNGPVQATFLVHEDFFLYERGIYSYSSLPERRGDSADYIKSGFHSVRIIGWGAERTAEGDIIKYWICANSWGEDWGEGGYFRIVRGKDESRIERYVVGVWGKISGDPILRGVLMENRRRRQRSRHPRHLNARRRRRRRRHNRRHQNRYQQDRPLQKSLHNKKESKKLKEFKSKYSYPKYKSSKKFKGKHKKGKNKKKKHFSKFYNSQHLGKLHYFFPGFKH